MGEGNESIEEIIQSILTGDAEHLPANYDKPDNESFSEDEKELYKRLDTALTGVLSLSQIEAKPVSIKEFCSRPENINLKSLCK